MAIDWYFPDWNQLPECARCAAVEEAERHHVDGQAALDIYNAIKREMANPRYMKTGPLKGSVATLPLEVREQ